eukprot:1148431-Pelagomonas_calceolata.AAC.5
MKVTVALCICPMPELLRQIPNIADFDEQRETDRGFTSSGGTTGGGSDDRAAERLGVSLFNSFSTNVW